ncbi:alpha/beta hydrolase [Daeguia caeni]|uniref:Alpha/beta hydrolase n=1 Tax=Daeguia caeni TaxID=439612 RepID=A0ABV9H1T8_9HYPH
MVKKMFIAALAAAALTCMTDAGSAEGQYVSATGQGRARNAIAASMKDMPGTPRLGAGVTMHEKKMTDETAASTPEQNFSRSKRFIHRFYTPENASNELIVLLHGSGGNEASLVPMAQRIWPRATLLGIRGRVMQDGGTRWYKRITPVKFDQKDIRLEANAFVTFLTRLADEKDLDLSRATFVGYSNGANLLASVMLLHPDLVKRAVLMRSMPVLDDAPMADLGKARVLTIAGVDDKLYSPFAPALSALLRSRGARVESRTIPADHMIGEQDVATISQWLASLGSEGNPAVSMQVQAPARKNPDPAQ